MPFDMSDVLGWPDALDTLQFTATTRTVGQNGIAADTAAAPVSFSAIVAPVAIRLIQQSDGALRDGAIEIFTQTRLSGGVKIDDANSRLPDIIAWHGRLYEVASVEDWTSFGAGFQRVTANLQQLNPTV